MLPASQASALATFYFTFTMSDSLPPVNEYKITTRYMVLFVSVVILCTYAGYIYGYSSAISTPFMSQSPQPPVNYTKRDFQKDIPSTFLDTVPLPDGVSFAQSYELSYASSSAQQATVVFSSSKSVIENYTLYEKFLEENEWWLPAYNKRAGVELSSLYANKYDEGKGLTYAINIVVSKADPRVGTSTSNTSSEVSISISTRKTSSDK